MSVFNQLIKELVNFSFLYTLLKTYVNYVSFF